MKYAYPQNPSAAVSTVRRFDETSNALTQQSDLDRKQSVALIGETVPMVFCSRGEFGNDQGVNGGVWVSPKLVQLGLEGERLSMMYLLSQGELTGIDPENVFWGQEKLLTQDDSANFCTAYEEIPDCLDLEYVPGAELGWTQTVIKAGPQGIGSFTTENNCRKINIAWESQISVSGSGTVVGGFGGEVYLEEILSWNSQTCQISSQFTRYGSGSPWKGSYTTQDQLNRLMNSGQATWEVCNVIGSCRINSCARRFDMKKHHLQASWSQTSEVRMDWVLVRVSDEEIITSGQVWVQDGTSSLLIDGLEPDKYRLAFSNMYSQRNMPVPQYVIPDPNGRQANFNSSYLSSYPTSVPNSNGFARYTYPGSVTQNISSVITQTLYTELVLPDLPGGEQQLVGGLRDLTMCGVEGNILELRPVGIDRFLQAHVFVEQGIQVERLLDGETGSSRLYADLVNYLMSTTKILQQDQIDTEALRLSAQMNQAYSIFFNGILQTTNSLSEWVTRTAPYFLLSARQVDGKYGLMPVCPLASNGRFKTTPVEPTFVITSDQIVEGSYTRQYMSNKERRPVCLVMVYRDQPTAQIGQQVTIEARYPGTALSGPFEQHDMTEFCCRGEHAVYAARYILAKRRHTTHACQLSIGRQGRAIKPGDIVRVNLNLETSEGAGITDSVMYQVESVNEGQNGTVQLELLHFPVDENGVSLVAQEIDTGSIAIS